MPWVTKSFASAWASYSPTPELSSLGISPAAHALTALQVAEEEAAEEAEEEGQEIQRAPEP